MNRIENSVKFPTPTRCRVSRLWATDPPKWTTTLWFKRSSCCMSFKEDTNQKIQQSIQQWSSPVRIIGHSFKGRTTNTRIRTLHGQKRRRTNGNTDTRLMILWL